MTLRTQFPPPRLSPDHQITIEEFPAFTDTRPDEERWELIEAVSILNAAPAQIHQLITLNIAGFLMKQKAATGASWVPLLGVGTRVPVSPNSLPQPDLYVQAGVPLDKPTTDGALVIFEIRSRSNTKADQAWRRRVYARVPNCRHYVTVSISTPAFSCYSRSAAWNEARLSSLTDQLELRALGVSLPLSAIYRWTPLVGVLKVRPDKAIFNCRQREIKGCGRG